MNSKQVFMAIAAIATLTFVSGHTVHATKGDQTVKTTKSSDKKSKTKVYKVKSGDTLEAIAKQHKLTYVQLFNANKSINNPDVIDVDDKIRIPAKDEKLPRRFAKFMGSESSTAAPAFTQSVQPAPATSYRSSTPTQRTFHGSSAGNTYAWGYCTWYVKNMRPDIPNRMGNGGQWVNSAAMRGMPTGNDPQRGAVAEQAGHVAYVEWVSADHKRVKVSEMNYGGGIGVVHKRTVPASMFRYIY